MRQYQTEVLVIGGGATGTGVIRDLAMRGFKCILVERRDLSDGTTGRFHGLLHSGGRYVVKDPLAAKECIEENRILRKIMPHCIEDTGGFFVITPWDDYEYAHQFVEGCKKAGIHVEEVSIQQMLREEPRMNKDIRLCFRVPDASADSFLASELNIEAARNYGAKIFTYHEITSLIKVNNRIVGAECHDWINDENLIISADMVILAAGAWTGRIASTVNIEIRIIPGKGTMIAINHRIVNTVINRCKPPSDGDVLVPIHSVSVMGTTDIKVSDPDHYAIEPWEIHLMLDEGEKIIPGFKQARILRAWAGLRPLYQETSAGDNRDVSRAYILLDHADRDSVDGLVTITSGKWTTFRKMAEVTCDLVCRKLNVERSCRTHLEALPKSKGKYHYLGAPLAEIEKDGAFSNLICECELVTYDDVLDVIKKEDTNTIDDIRRDIRLGMGPCQGGFCTYRVAGILHKIRKIPVEKINVILRDFLKERWKGLLPVLIGSQLRQERLDELIYLNVLNVTQLPGKKSSDLSPKIYDDVEIYREQEKISENRSSNFNSSIQNKTMSAVGKPVQVLVIGGSLAGLISALIASINQKKTRLITKGWGSLYWETGCIDVLGHSYLDNNRNVLSPIEDIQSLIKENPQHPYALIGIDNIFEALDFFNQFSIEVGYPFEGSIHNNWMLPTAIGTIRPTCLAPKTMIAGDVRKPDPMLIIGIEGFHDHYAGYLSDNLNAQGILSRHKTITLNSLKGHRLITSMQLARMFESKEFRDEIIEQVNPILGRAARIGFPAVLGLMDCLNVHADLEERLGRPVFEIPGIPPSIPGMRLHNLLVARIMHSGGSVFEGMEVAGFNCDQNRLTTIYTEASARMKPHISSIFVLATGGILGGGIRLEQSGILHEVALDIPVPFQLNRDEWFSKDFSENNWHPIYKYGVHTNHEFIPVDESGDTIYENLYAVGGILGNCDPIRESSSGGLALATGFKIGKTIQNTI